MTPKNLGDFERSTTCFGLEERTFIRTQKRVGRDVANTHSNTTFFSCLSGEEGTAFDVRRVYGVGGVFPPLLDWRGGVQTLPACQGGSRPTQGASQDPQKVKISLRKFCAKIFFLH